MSFRVRIELCLSWCLLLLSCSTQHNSLDGFNLTGAYTVVLDESDEVTGLKKTKDGDSWTDAELTQILSSVKIMGKISPTQTLLISDPGYLDVAASNCDENCAKGQSWVYDETENTLVQIRKITDGKYENPADLELDQNIYNIHHYSAAEDAVDDNKYGSKYYWVKDEKGNGDNLYWAQSTNTSLAKDTATYKLEDNAAHQCANDPKRSNRSIAVKYSIKPADRPDYIRRNLTQCFYALKRVPKILYLRADSLILYTENHLVYFNADYPKGMTLPPDTSEQSSIVEFFDDADGIQAGLGARDSFWVKRSSTAMMFHKGDENEETTTFNYTKFDLPLTADKMAMWVDREPDGDADSKVKITNKIVFIESGKLKTAAVAWIAKAYAEASEGNNEDDDSEDDTNE
ncbi:MAG: hypothetical protein OYH77_02380 [Pseudomonadota bacterium]|nr:hypothetical protein [Pseudomonadota bacterium]